jgi:hypothetical protein
MNAPYYRVEVIRGFRLLKSRKFKHADDAIRFVNDWYDQHEEDDAVQIITPSGAIHQTNTNGNTAYGSIR